MVSLAPALAFALALALEVPGARRTMARDKIILACTQCQSRNYHTMKNKRKHPERVEWKKHCPRCNLHTMHKETK